MPRAAERGCSSGVEHNLAKVGVEGSNPFARSNFSQVLRAYEGPPLGGLFVFWPSPKANPMLRAWASPLDGSRRISRQNRENLMANARHLSILKELERKVLWLSTWTIHNANHLRASERRLEGRRAPGVLGLARHDHDGALFRGAAAGGPGGGEAACQPDLPRHPVSARAARPGRSWRISAATRARNPIPPAPRTSTTSISPPARSASASRRRCSPAWCRIT